MIVKIMIIMCEMAICNNDNNVCVIIIERGNGDSNGQW